MIVEHDNQMTTVEIRIERFIIVIFLSPKKGKLACRQHQSKKQNSDKIMCSAGQGEMTKDACLTALCSSRTTAASTYTLLNAMYPRQGA